MASRLQSHALVGRVAELGSIGVAACIMRFSQTIAVGLISVVVVSCAHVTKPARAGVTIRAVRAVGDTFYLPHPQPIWRFAITNSDSSDAQWMCGIEVRGGGDDEYSHAGGFIDWPEGVLASGQGIETNMIVPAKAGSAWRAYVDYWTLPSRNLKTYHDEWNH